MNELSRRRPESSSSAEALLGEGERDALAEQPPDLRRAAELARQAGALATSRDTKAALAAYQRAASYEPDNPDNWWMLGNLLMDSLRRPEATQAYRRLIETASENVRNEPTNSRWRAMLGVGYRQVATALLAQDNVTEAASLAAQSLTLAEQWPANQLESREAQDALILGRMLVARVHLDEGHLALQSEQVSQALPMVRSKAEASLAVYEQALTHINKLLDRDVDDDDLWLKHSDCHEGRGWAMALASHSGARGEFLKSAATLERIVQRNPESDFYRDRLAASYQILGGYMATIETNPAAALDVYRKGLALRQQLADQNPSNPRWQLDLVQAYQSIASLAQVWASVPSLLDTNYRDHMKPPPIKSPEAISFLRNAQRILRQLDEQGLLLAREQRLDRQMESDILDLECQQKGFESNLGGRCIRPLPAHMKSR